MSFLCVFFLPGHQLLSRSGGPWSDYSRTEGAHNAANHFPPGTGSWGKVPYQVSSLKTSTLLTADFLWGGGGNKKRRGEQVKRCWKINSGASEGSLPVGCTEGCVCMYEINADSVA